MMKALIGLLVLSAVVFSWNKFTADAGESEMEIPSHSSEVILYSTSWCGYCAKTRKYFEDNQIPFVEYDVEKSSEGREQYHNLNGKGVPLLVVNGEVIRGFNPAAIKQAMTIVR